MKTELPERSLVLEEINTGQEVYALAEVRSCSAVIQFLDRFLPVRSPCSDDYWVTEPGGSKVFLTTEAEEAMLYLEEHMFHECSFYWQNVSAGHRLAERDVATAMAFFTNDGCLIIGLAVDERRKHYWKHQLTNVAGTQFCYFGWEAPPPLNAKEFKIFCQTLDQGDLAEDAVEPEG